MDQIIKRIISFILAASFALCLPFVSMAAESDATAKYLIKNVPDPTSDSVGGEWTVVGLSGCSLDVKQQYFDTYLKNLSDTVKECKGVLSEDSYTEYSRVIIALTSMGKDALDVEGYDLVEPLKDSEKVIEQGINGAIYALIALDKGHYLAPRKVLRDYILDNELPNGGWSYWGGDEADPDLTAMAVQALSRYKYYKDVKPVIARAMPILNQKEYDSSETLSQVIIALDSLDIEPSKDLKNQLLKYRLADGSFKHSLDEDEGNLMSTEQALIALSVFE